MFKKTAILQESRSTTSPYLLSSLHKNIEVFFLVMLTKAVIILNSYQVCEKADFSQQELAYAAFRNSYTDHKSKMLSTKGL